MTHSNLFVAMGREADFPTGACKKRGRPFMAHVIPAHSDVCSECGEKAAMMKVEWCDKCGGTLYSGSWPWCGSGGARDHDRF